MGVAKLTVSSVDDLLKSKGLISAQQSVCHARTAEERVAIRTRLHQLGDAGFARLFVRLSEKRGKWRSVGFPLDLITQLLTHVWGERTWFARSHGVSVTVPQDPLWISHGGGPLLIGSIRDIVASGFRAVGVPGSIHSLRAAFITEKAVELLRLAKANHGSNFDEFAILHELAELAGHNDPSTLRHYLDQARIREAVFDAEGSGETGCDI